MRERYEYNPTYPNDLWDNVEKTWVPKDSVRPNWETKPNGTKKQFKLVPFSEIKLDTASACLIKSLIPRTGLIVVWGPPKCGKSFSDARLLSCIIAASMLPARAAIRH
jgi:hypothetical protein